MHLYKYSRNYKCRYVNYVWNDPNPLTHIMIVTTFLNLNQNKIAFSIIKQDKENNVYVKAGYELLNNPVSEVIVELSNVGTLCYVVTDIQHNGKPLDIVFQYLVPAVLLSITEHVVRILNAGGDVSSETVWRYILFDARTQQMLDAYSVTHSQVTGVSKNNPITYTKSTINNDERNQSTTIVTGVLKTSPVAMEDDED